MTAGIDAHNHVIPTSCLELARRDPAGYQVAVERRGALTWLRHAQGYEYELQAEFHDPAAKLDRLERASIDGAIVSLSPTFFGYWLDREHAEQIVRAANEGIAAFCARSTERLRGLGVVPLDDVESAVKELEYAIQSLGLVGVEIGTNVNGRSLDDVSFEPFFAAVEALNVPVFIHPSYVGLRAGLEQFYLTNVVGNPVETTVAGMRLIAGGVLDRHPQLVVGLAHGGGFFPYQLGRLRHAATVRPELKQPKRSPMEYKDQFHFDSITHDPRALRFLIEWAGAERVVLGSDFPFDMADPNPVETLEQALPDYGEMKDQVMGDNARRIYGFRGKA